MTIITVKVWLKRQLKLNKSSILAELIQLK